jgi:hypothetical protein
MSFPRQLVRDFVSESNRIEGIPKVRPHEITAHERLLAAIPLSVADVVEFVEAIAHAPIRSREGMDVRVGRYRPPNGGPEIVTALDRLLDSHLRPFEFHVAYEALHPFMDGNGRSGRALWLRDMGGIEHAPLGFLHHFYYQTLDARQQMRVGGEIRYVELGCMT